MTREEQLEKALAAETETQNKLRAEIAELRAQLAAPAPAAASEAKAADKAPAPKPASPAK